MKENKTFLAILYENKKYIEAVEYTLNYTNLERVLRNIMILDESYCHKELNCMLKKVTEEKYKKWLDKKLPLLYNSINADRPILIGKQSSYNYKLQIVDLDNDDLIDDTRYGIWGKDEGGFIEDYGFIRAKRF